MSVETSRTLGGIGAILLLIGTFPGISGYTYGIIALIGLILVLTALYQLAGTYSERGIFNNAIYGVITGIVGAAITVGVAVIAFFSFLSSAETFISQFYPGWTPGDWTALSGMTPIIPATIDYSSLTSILGSIIAAIVAIFAVVIIFAVVATYFFRRSLQKLSEKAGVGLFATAGLVLFIGAFLLILLIIPGLIVMWIAVLLLAIAFFQIKPQQAPMTPTPSQPTPTTT